MNKQANDIDGEHASKARFAVVTASSSGGLHALSEILSRLPHDFPGAVLVVQHRAPSPPYLLAQILGRRTTLNVMDAHEGAAITAGTVYIASPEAHLVVRPDRTLGYIDHQRIRFLRSSANPLLESASKVYGKNLVAVVLTGADSDATDGVQSVRKHGGFVIAQDRGTSQIYAMPRSAIETGCVDKVLPLEKIPTALTEWVRHDDALHPRVSAS